MNNTPVNTSKKMERIARDIRNVALFVFFALTIGASAGLFSDTHEANNGIAADTQTAELNMSGLFSSQSGGGGVSFVNGIRDWVMCHTGNGCKPTKMKSDTLKTTYEQNTYTIHYPKPAPDLNGYSKSGVSSDGYASYSYVQNGKDYDLIYNSDSHSYRIETYGDNGYEVVGRQEMQANDPPVLQAKEIINKQFNNEINNHPDAFSNFEFNHNGTYARHSVANTGTQGFEDRHGSVYSHHNKAVDPPSQPDLSAYHSSTSTDISTEYGLGPISQYNYLNASSTPKDLPSPPDLSAYKRYTVQNNRCSTTYVTINTTGKTTVRECYGTQRDKAHILVAKLASCMAAHYPNVKTADAMAKIYPQLRTAVNNGMCLGEKAVVNKKPSGKYFALLSEKPVAFYSIGMTPPSACIKEYKDVLGVMGAINGNTAQDDSKKQTSQHATMNDVAACEWKGASVCFTRASGFGGLVCKRKADVLHKIKLSILPSVSVPSSHYETNYQAPVQSNNSLVSWFQNSSVPYTLGKMFGSIFGKVLKGGSKSCPAGYERSGGQNADGSPSCRKKAVANIPQCAIAASKNDIKSGEKILVRWKTVDANTVNIDGIGAGVSADGEKYLTPEVTTTYTLTAKNKSGEKQCSTTIVVDGVVDGPSGAYPPRVSCTPPIIRGGDSAKISWECSGGADSSKGIGFDTKGALIGTMVVQPQANTGYRVKCLKNGKEIGANMCSVRVGDAQYDIIAYPKEVAVNERARISWASLLTESCRVTGPRGFDYAHTEGVVITEPFGNVSTSTTAVYTLTCKTKLGNTVTKDAVIRRK